MSSGTNNQSSIKDNYGFGTVFEFLQSKIKPNSTISIVSAYFTIHAYDKLSDELEKIEELRLLLGSQQTVSGLGAQNEPPLEFELVESEIQLSKALQQRYLAQKCANWINSKVEVRKPGEQTRLIHGKMYYIESNGVKDVLIGSSNFTSSGIGSYKPANLELNMLVQDDRDRDNLKIWFNDIWDETQDAKQEIIDELEQIHKDYSPQEIYFKTLYEIFKDRLDEKQREKAERNLKNTRIWTMLYGFQKEGALIAIHKLDKYNGCIIADSVGLGKTYEALAVIKHYLANGKSVLVMCPKRLEDNWKRFQATESSIYNPFSEDNLYFTLRAHTDIATRAAEETNWAGFDLVVIDESHNFRNRSSRENSRYRQVMEKIIKSGTNKHVLMLSATPVNMGVMDLYSQINFMTREDDKYYSTPDKLGIRNLKTLFNESDKIFNDWAKSGARDKESLVRSLEGDFTKVLDAVSFARSRKHIREQYKDSLAEVGDFPEHANPDSKSPRISKSNSFMNYEDLAQTINSMNLALYMPGFYLKDEHKNNPDYIQTGHFADISFEAREKTLVGMMRVNLLKRLESSVHSFKKTLNKIQHKIDNEIALINNYQQNATATDTIQQRLDEEESGLNEDGSEPENTINEFLASTKVDYKLAHLDLAKLKDDLQEDREKLQEIIQQTEKVIPADDKKLEVLREIIHKKAVQSPTKNKDGSENRKILIFTAFSDTARYLYDNIKDELKAKGLHVALVGGAAGNENEFGENLTQHIVANFSPNSNHNFSPNHEARIDILIATDCISEGQNMQDCDMVINYDIHWNPVRILQRFGRIDRIGSPAQQVQMTLFWPTEDLNTYLNLERRVETRMALVKITAADTQELPNEQLLSEENNFRHKQIKMLKDEIPDPDELAGGFDIGDFSLSDFTEELLNFISSNRKKLEDMPYGVFTCVKSDENDIKPLEPGVVFCFKHNSKLSKLKRSKPSLQQKEQNELESINPISPYYLVYVSYSGEVQVRFTHPKKTLELMRKLCANESKADRELCKLFDEETKNGQDMTLYNNIITSATKDIMETIERRILAFAKENFVIPRGTSVPQSENDLSLVTWLVIKNG